MSVAESTIHDIDDADVALKFILRANRATFWETDQFGNIFIHKAKPGRGSQYERIGVPKDMLGRIGRRLEHGEPLQDFEGLLEPKPVRRRGLGKYRSGKRR